MTSSGHQVRCDDVTSVCEGVGQSLSERHVTGLIFHICYRELQVHGSTCISRFHYVCMCALVGGPFWDPPPLKLKTMKVGFRHVLSWSKRRLEPKCHDAGTFGGFGKRGHTDRQTRFMFYMCRY